MDLLVRLAEPAHIDDPFPYLAWLRENDPLHRLRAGGRRGVPRVLAPLHVTLGRNGAILGGDHLLAPEHFCRVRASAG